MALLKLARSLRIRRPLSSFKSRQVPYNFAYAWGDRVFRNVYNATGDPELASKTANKVYRKIMDKEVA